MEPTSFEVEEGVTQGKKGEVKYQWTPTRLMTRQTYTIDGVSGTMTASDGKIKFNEEDGIDYAATTVQLPGGARVPFLFSVKELKATSDNGDALKPGLQFGGSFKVPSYRTGLFLDPKGRGTTTGYDQAGALPGIQNGVDGDSFMFKENNKVFDVLKGDVEFAVSDVDMEAGEFGGVFVSQQPSDTDMGGKEPKQILLKGKFFGKIEAKN